MKEYNNISELIDATKSKLGELLTDHDFSTATKTANNDVTHLGICIKKHGMNAAPIFYMDDFYKKYAEGSMSIDDIVKIIFREYLNHVDKAADIVIDSIIDFNKAKEHIFYTLVSSKGNDESLAKCVTEDFLDLKKKYCLFIPDIDDGVGSIKITNEVLKAWNVSADEVIALGNENTPKLFPPTITNILSIVPDELKEIMPELPMWILSNNTGHYGAAAMTYDGVLDEIADNLDSDFYIIPSSTEECIILCPDGMESNDVLIDTIKEVNNTMVDPEQVLSYSLYYYDKDNKELTMVGDERIEEYAD